MSQVIAILGHLCVVVFADVQDEPKEKWGYVNVRQHANMFWWLYNTTHSKGYRHTPLVIWLQVRLGGYTITTHCKGYHHTSCHLATGTFGWLYYHNSP